MECSVDGCIRGAFRTGLCAKHYGSARKVSAPRCSKEDCEIPVHGRGLCNQHYRAALAQEAASCAISGCARPAIAKGLCDAHRQRKAKHGHLDPTRAADWGSRRGHPLYGTWSWHMRHKHRGNFDERWHDFWEMVSAVGERPSPTSRLVKIGDGVLGPENFTWREPELPFVDEISGKKRASKYQSQYRQRHPDRVAAYRFKAAYGMASGEYEAMRDAQGDLCAICRRPEVVLNKTTLAPRRLAVDHCHATGKVRALLCSQCNGGLGNFSDDIDRMKAAIAYLEHHLPKAEE